MRVANREEEVIKMASPDIPRGCAIREFHNGQGESECVHD